MKLNLPLEPKHPLIRWANSIRAFYGHPVYLVGSQLTDKPNPRDVDVVCILPDEEFSLRYGDVNEWRHESCTSQYTEDVYWAWSDDCVKKSLGGMKETGLKIDFRVYPPSTAFWFDDQGYPKLKLDTRRDNKPEKKPA